MTTSMTDPEDSIDPASQSEPTSIPDSISQSLYARLDQRFSANLGVARLTRTALLGITRTMERYLVTQGLPFIVFINYQKISTWQNESSRYKRDQDLIKMLVAFVVQPEQLTQLPDGNLPVSDNMEKVDQEKETLILLPASDALHQDHFLIVLTDRFSLLVCGKARANVSGQEASRLYDTIISFEPEVIDYALEILEQALQRYDPSQLARLQSERKLFKTIPPDPRTIAFLTAQFVEQIHFYRQKGRQYDQEKAMRATIGRLLHDASQPVTLLVSLLDFATKDYKVSAEEIEMMLGSANQLKQILDHLREVNRFRTRKIGDTEYLDTGQSFF